MGSKMKYNFLIGSVTFLVLLAMPCSGDLNINMIPEVFDVKGGKTKTFFGAAVAIQSESIFAAAPYWSKTVPGIFECELGEDDWAAGSISSGI